MGEGLGYRAMDLPGPPQEDLEIICMVREG